jgi:hypothetical protein
MASSPPGPGRPPSRGWTSQLLRPNGEATLVAGNYASTAVSNGESQRYSEQN